jgi:hypothetical protein
MKKIVFLLGLALVFVPALRLSAQYADFPGLKKAMPAEDYESAGLQKLSDEQRARLDEFLREYLGSSTKKVAEKSAAEAVDRAVERKEAAAPSVIESKIVGPFNGYNGRTVFALDNGQKWRQVQHDSANFKTVDSPRVVVVKDQVGYRMYIVGGGDTRVEQMKTPQQPHTEEAPQ